ncbi:hypothetical protein Pla22_42660 [Rubripirellula amarantea]|uniref:Cadherin domain-containing protein n=1 Tax=Rubripirellula amarantea TaxID=2527999 RepID=A0A5C5WEB3_9BACT|nr:tandem-95 repeat protein [Rubripirellula amarantea]TWT49074.1 hypothetical protein Pla22_42660 [Rubripirellula amarantea]
MTKRKNLRRRKNDFSMRNLHHEALEKRELLAAEFGLNSGPRLISVAANSGEQFRLQDNNVLSVAPSELTFRFDGAKSLDESTLAGIRIIGSGGDGTFGETNDVLINPGFLGFASDDNARIVVARFAETLPDDQYMIEVAGFDDTDPNNLIVGLRNVDGELFCPPDPSDLDRPTQAILMNVEVGPRVTAVVPQPIEGLGSSREQLVNTIDVYFNNDPLSNRNAGTINNNNSMLPVVQPRFYQLVYTGGTIERTDDAVTTPTTVSYDPVLNRARLTFPGGGLSNLVPASANGGGTFRLRVGSGEAISNALPGSFDASADAGDTFSTAQSLGVTFGNTTQSIVVSEGLIEAKNDIAAPWPGAADASGLRDYRRDAPTVGRVDSTTGINVFEYNFANLYGEDTQGNNLDNAITDAQRQRLREVLDLYSERLGVEFVETANSGLQIVTGDLRAIAISVDTGSGVPYSAYRVNDQDPTKGVLVLDAGENWYDGYGVSPDTRPSWFVEALRGVGSLLGLGNTFELPAGDATGGSSPAEPTSQGFLLGGANLPVEPDFLTQGNIIAGQALHRPESNDVDLYEFTAVNEGKVTAEAFAQRLEDSSLLDTYLTLYKVVDAAAGQYELVATNDDFFSDDSLIGVDLVVNRDANGNPVPTKYVIGVSAAGNEEYNAKVANSGLGGVTEGKYELRVTFVPQVGDTITDTSGSALDGDGDGREGGDFNFWFRVARDVATPAADEPRVIFVDKFDGDDVNGDGTILSPYRTISTAFSPSVARPNDIVRLLPNGGNDGLIQTDDDNLAYEIGRGGSGNRVLADGGDFEVPKGVTVMIDAGAILKLRSAKISVGSESVDEDRSLAALQILGTPTILDANGNSTVEGLGTVFITSYDDATKGFDTNGLAVLPQPGNWAGIEFRNDFDLSEGRGVWEREGIFLDYSSHAEIRYGGGSISSSQPAVSPLQMSESRPTLIYNTIIDNADAAISADPNSFRETNFHSPLFQRVAGFTSDYDRVGPEISGNRLLRNTTNGLFVRVVTPAVGQTEPMTVAGRFDDRDIVHVLSQVLVLQGQPGGPLKLADRPDVMNVTFSNATSTGTGLVDGDLYDYRLTYVTSEGRESLASLPTTMRAATASGALRLNNLPAAPAEYAGRRLYRLDPDTGEYGFIAQLDRSSTFFVDHGNAARGTLPDAAEASDGIDPTDPSDDDTRYLPRFDARLSIDPGLIIKSENARIEAGFGSDFYAEGADGDPIIFTSRLDDDFGAGGTFDTNSNATPATPGNWGGLVFRQDATASLDYVEVRYGGSTTPIAGGFASSNAVEILQADVRIAHSVFRDNADGFQGQSVRAGRGFNGPATIFVRGSQPIIVDNTIIDNEGAAISINPDALDFTDNLDHGRATGVSDLFVSDRDNQGPLISDNRIDRNGINGLLVRSEELQTESVWDDTDIVHVVNGQIITSSHYQRGGLRLRSDANQSLVVKFGPNGELIGTGQPLDIDDRIGGTLQVLGQPGFPVILTSLADDSVGAGFTSEGIAQTNTDNVDATPAAGDWQGITLLPYVNDRNVAYVLENERAIPAAVTENAIADSAQVIGSLASDEYSGDENERLGFHVRGTLASDTDRDVYKFEADGGTVVYIDIDDTSYGLDTIVELIDVNNQVLARSDNSFAERTATSGSTTLLNNLLSPGAVRPLFVVRTGNVETENGLDAGMRVVLDGTGTDNDYYIRVRSKNASSSGQYSLSIRLREADEVAGSTVQLADIRYATDAITVSGAPLHSPLTGEATEDLNYLGNGTAVDVDTAGLTFSNANAAQLGNLLTTDRASLKVSGNIGNIAPTAGFAASDDIDVYQIDLFAQDIEPDVFDFETRFVTTTFDVDYADGLGRVNTSLAVFDSTGRLILHSRDSNIADDVGRPFEGDDTTNLQGGSTGVLDAHIGPVELPEGTYYVAVSSAIAVPQSLDQFFLDTPTNTDVRIMPINSIRRISDDVIGVSAEYTADAPIVSPIFDANSVVNYGLDDVRLFVNLNGSISGNNATTLTSFNPFTGVMERLVGQSGQPTDDLAIRRDGELQTFSTGPQPGTGPKTGANTGNFLQISPADGTATNIGDDGVTFQRNNAAGDDLEADPDAELQISAIAFPISDGDSPHATNVNTVAVADTERFIGVGYRDNNGRGTEMDLSLYSRNLIYQFVSSSGEITSRGSTDTDAHRTFDGTSPYSPSDGAATADVEFGIIDTGNIFNTGGDGGDITGIAIVPDAVNPNGLAGNDSTTVLAVTDRGGVHFFDYTDSVPGPGTPFLRASNIIRTTYYGVVTPDPRHVGASVNPITGGVQFTGMTLGPRTLNNGEYRQTMFATTADGWLYGLEIDGGELVPANVFYNGRSAIPLTFEGTTPIGRAPNGLAFSLTEQNPWHVTNDRDDEDGHFVEQPYDGSRTDTIGGNSLYFGFEIDGSADNNTVSRPDGDPLGELAAGGAHGTVISNPFSLEGYSPDDKPTLYFTYYLEVEAGDDYTGPTDLQNDSFRAYAAGDDGVWQLLATNNEYRSAIALDEFDQYQTSEIPVQELFDSSPGEQINWRQARVDISPFAGSENVRIRFDFSTAGNLRHQYGSFELVATDGDQITDRETLNLIDNDSGSTVSFTTIVGKDIVIPNGTELEDGDAFILDGPGGPTTITFVTGPATNPGEVQFSAAESASVIAQKVIRAIPQVMRAVSDGGPLISVLAATNVVAVGDSPIGESNPVRVTQTSDQLIVPDGIFLSSGDGFTVTGAGTTTTIVFVEAADALGNANEFIFSPAESALQISSRLIDRFPEALDAILETDGRITFMNSPIGLTAVAATAVNSTSNLQVTQNRLELLIPDGDGYTDGSVMTISNATETVSLEFVMNPVPEGPGTVHFFSGVTQSEMVQRVLAALPASFDPLVNSTDTGLLVFADNATHSSIVDQPIPVQAVQMPDGTTPLMNDTLRIFGALGTTTINFIEVAVATTAIPGTVYYQTTDTAAEIAANLDIAIPNNEYISTVIGDTVTIYDSTGTATTDPDSDIVDGPTLGFYVRLPNDRADFEDDDELQIISPYGNVNVTFEDQDNSTVSPPVVGYAPGPNNQANFHELLQSVLPSGLRAIVINNNVSGPVVQILGATAIRSLDPDSLIEIGANSFSRTVTNIDVKDGVDLRSGESITVSLGGLSETIVFLQEGSTAPPVAGVSIFYNDADLGSDLYADILNALPFEFQAFIDLDGNGINIGAPGATVTVNDGAPQFLRSSIDIDESAIPILVPAGSELDDGEQLQIISKDDILGTAPITITFVEGIGGPVPGQVFFQDGDTSAQIASKLNAALPPSLQGYLFSSREVYLLNASSVATLNPNSAIVSYNVPAGNIPILVDSTMTSEEIAPIMQVALAEGFGRLATTNGDNFASAEDYQIFGGDRIRVYNATPVDVGSYGVSAYVSPFLTGLPTEIFGEARPTAIATNQVDSQGGAENDITGVYLTDIIIGFAERGEMVLNAPNNLRDFVLNPETTPDTRAGAVQPERPNETLTGGYSLEIRTSDEYGVSTDFPGGLAIIGAAALGRSFDTNDRLNDEAVTLIAQAGIYLLDGDTFVLDNGTRQLTYEFDSSLEPGVTNGNVPVFFDPTNDQSFDTAAAIRNAINSAQSYNALGIRAATGDSLEVGVTTSDRVELFGDVIMVNPGRGRFIKLDLVDEETFQGRETSKLIPVVDHDSQTVTYTTFGDQPARAAVTNFIDGASDVIVAVGKIGDQVTTGNSADNKGPVLLANAPADDIDFVRIYMGAGQSVDIDVDSAGFTRGAEVLTQPLITILDEDSSLNAAGQFINAVAASTVTVAPGESQAGAFLRFTAPTDGYYDIAISSADGSYGEYQLTVRPNAAFSPEIPDRDVLMVDYHFGTGDVNRVDEQGQLIISSNLISNASGFGIRAESGQRGLGVASGVGLDELPRPGVANLLRNVNTDQLIPGTVIVNNLIVDAASGGILYSGGTANNGQSPAAVPIGRIVNNTVVGNQTGSGIIVQSNASPTILNNLISGFDTGLNVDASSEAAGTTVGGNAYHANVTANSNIPLDSTDITIAGEVFQDPARGIYIPRAGSNVIDSSFSSLDDRTEFVNTVKQPVGLASSPIIAPLFDAYGQPRFDDPLINPAGPGGGVVTIDRGAIDRADRTQPVAVLTTPEDAIGIFVVGGDQDTDESFVRLTSGTVEFFEIQLLDPAGTGPDKDTITPESVLLTENGRRLVPDVDFVFGYSDNSRTIRLTPLAGLWLPDAVYEITLNNQSRVAYESPIGANINDGDQISITDSDQNQVTFEYESGYSIQVPQTTLLTITNANNGFNDRDVITIGGQLGRSVSFEINKNTVDDTAAANVEINLSNATTTGEVRNAILAALMGTVPGNPSTNIVDFLNIVPTAVGREQIQLGTLAGMNAPNEIAGLTVSGDAGGIADEQTFTYTPAGGTAVTFEFNSQNGLRDSNNVEIAFTRQDTPAEIAAKIDAAVSVAGIGLGGAAATDAGVVVLGGELGDTIDVSQSLLVLSGSPGVTGSLTLQIPAGETGASLNDETFSITSNGVTIPFRYTTNSLLTAPERLILLSATDLTTGIATKTAAVIASAFSGDLAPVAVGDTVTLNERADLTTVVTPGSAGLIVSGVNGGAIPVSFLATSPATSTAASLVGAIQSAVNDGLLNVETFAPGGGTILISNVDSFQGSVAGGPLADIGTIAPAITDLAGNPVRETRPNNETRFSIIMPDVIFDFGDAPAGYATLLANNGARHTISENSLPRLGAAIDSETDGQPTNQDDSLLVVSATSPDLVSSADPAIGVFEIDTINSGTTVQITIVNVPQGGETIDIVVGGQSRTFELVDLNSNPADGNIPVVFSIVDDPNLSQAEDDAINIARITQQLTNAVSAAIPQSGDGLEIRQGLESQTPAEAADSNLLSITSIDDEDGVAIGDIFDATDNTTYKVFLRGGTDPATATIDDVIGFLNPLDRAGTSLDISVAGSGLLQVWIDFNGDGVFDETDKEHPPQLTDLPVTGNAETGEFVTINVPVPADAKPGLTWMRVRISESGGLTANGVAVGGEVEDYQVEIIPIGLPDPVDDAGYTVTERGTLDTLADGLPTVASNDPNPNSGQFLDQDNRIGFLTATFLLGEEPANGTVTLDPATGHFVYEPQGGFFGTDTFTYRVSTRENESAANIPADRFATVTITVTPENDVPTGVSTTKTAQEDLPRIFAAAELLVGASANLTPDYVNGYPTTGDAALDQLIQDLINETNQNTTLAVGAVAGSAGTITAANAADDGGNLVVSETGTGLNIQVTSATAGDVITIAHRGQTRTFELVAVGQVAGAGTTPISLVDGDTPQTIADRLRSVITGEFAGSTASLTATAVNDTVQLRYTATDVNVTDSRLDTDNNDFIVVTGNTSPNAGITLTQTPVPKAAVVDAAAGDRVTLIVGASSFVFEFVTPGATAGAGNIPVVMLPFAGGGSGQPEPDAIRQSATINLAEAIKTTLRNAGVEVIAELAANGTLPQGGTRYTVELKPASITAGKSHDTDRGSIIPVFDSYDELIEVRYLSGLDLNRDNPPPSTPDKTDEFSFQVVDNRVSIQLVDQEVTFDTTSPNLSAAAVITLDVTPQNDAPVLRPDTVDGIEDTPLTITPATLLANDSLARDTAADENVPGTTNDGALSLVSVTMVDNAQGSVALVGGNVVFTPAANVFGEVLFTYAARDQGINEGLDLTRVTSPLTTNNGTVTVNIAGVNDPPTANDRAITEAESNNAGPGAGYTFTSSRLIFGNGTDETPNAAGDFPPSLQAPFDESNQVLRVFSFETDAGRVSEDDLPTGVGTETLRLQSNAGLILNPTFDLALGGYFDFNFVDGVFTTGRYVPPADYNDSFPSPVLATESFLYTVADDGTPNAVSHTGDGNGATVSFTITPANDAPTFDFTANAPVVNGLANLNVLEDDNGVQISNFAINILGGPTTALDESRDQTVTFSFDPAKNLNVTSSGLFTQLPTLSDDGTLTVYPAADRIGSATLVVTATDSVTGSTNRSTDRTFVINVRPVNDAPRFASDIGHPRSDALNADDAYAVAAIDSNNDSQIDDATITYTLKEDNTGAQGDTSTDYFIPLRAGNNTGYNRIGLLDVFNVGPANEADVNAEGGAQTLEFLQAGNDAGNGSTSRLTTLGGMLTPVFEGGVLVGLNYRPPTDLNFSFAGVDSFMYTVRDDSPGNETFDLTSGALVPDRLTSQNRVQLILNPVNDRPEFVAPEQSIEVQEDTSLIQFEGFATNISAGPANTAFDEVDAISGQLVEFTVTPLDFPLAEAGDFFSVYPTINEQNGLLSFQPSANVFGTYLFDVVLTDRERDNSQIDDPNRGDLVSSIPITLTITVNPVNDPPMVDPNADPLSFEILEDGVGEVLVRGDSTGRGLLDVFLPGPGVGRTDEAANVTPGGNQTVSLGSPLPSSSAEGGTVVFDNSGASPKFIYRPRPNFVGTDSFIYTVIDNGQTVEVGGQVVDDPRISSNTVTFEVLPVNDAPIFSGAATVDSAEDDGLVVVQNWVTNVQAGPTTAVDEIDGFRATPAQGLEFKFTNTTDNEDLFVTAPRAVRDPDTGVWSLEYQTAQDANGTAVYTVVLEDTGPRDAGIGDRFVSSPVRTFTINVAPVNDPPTLTILNSTISLTEDNGPFSILQVDPFSPGPADEQSQTVSFDIEPLPAEYAVLFTEPPTINADGVLRFTPAPNRNTDNVNGPVPVRVIARDSAGEVADAVTFSIEISEVNDSPRANSDSFSSDEDSVLQLSSADLLSNDVDPDLTSNASEVVRVVLPVFSTSVSGAEVRYDSATGAITYDPTNAAILQALAPGETIVDTFSYSLIDAAGLRSNLVTVGIDIAGINDAPRLGLDTPTLNPDGPTIIRPLDNDTDVDGTIDAGSIQITLQPAFGSLAVQADGSMIYTPFGSFTEEDVFRYTVADNLGLRSEEQLVSIAANASPIALDDRRGTFLDESLIIDVSENDYDPDGDLNLASITVVQTPLRGTAVPQADGTVQYLPSPGFVGIDTFGYRIADQDGRLSNIATVTVQVVASRLQNPDRFSDVNDDGFVTAIDALLIVNRISRSDGQEIPVLSTDRGPNFFDTSGDQTITALDALRVVNELSRINNGSGIEREQVFAPLTTLDAQQLSISTEEVDALSQVADELESKLVDASPATAGVDDIIALIASDSKSDDDDDTFATIDDVIANLV